MSKWEEISDFEINKEVGDILGVDWVQGLHFNFKGRLQYFNPCNSWTHAGPIIQDQKIWIREISGIWISKGFPGKYHPYNEVSWEDKNPLRAAMIVFLMMNEDKGNE